MEEDGQRNVSPEPAQDQVGLTPQPIIQPTEVMNQESQPTQPLKPSAVTSQFEIDPAVQPDNKQEVVPAPVTPSISEKDAMPIGMSASQLGLDASRRHFYFGWRRNIRNVIYPVAILLVIIGGFLFWKYYVDGMTTEKYSLGGYTYSYTFFRSAKYKRFSNGMQGYSVNQEVNAIIGPITDNPDYCAELGTQYTRAFTVQVYGSTYPVCQAHNNLNDQLYGLDFTTQNQSYAFVIVCSASQNAKVYPRLQSIFKSIKVSKG